MVIFGVKKYYLQTTRLGKHVNELRRKTDNDSLSKRAKELVKKWRTMVLPDPNGQLKPASEDQRKRFLRESPPETGPKKPKLNGQNAAEYELSDNSNSSFKDVKNVILINSDSNSSLVEAAPLLEQQQPKKRGRKKGSKNHKNLLDEAETSFTNKLAVSRGNSKVKTTQELIAGLQNKQNLTSPNKPKEDLSLRAAKLTERVSIIDKKLNTNSNRYKNSQKRALQKITFGSGGEKNDRVIESGSVINDRSLLPTQEEEVIVVDDPEPLDSPEIKEELNTEEDELKITSLSIEEALRQLPPIDPSVLESDEKVFCTCHVEENPEFSEQKFQLVEDSNCPARLKFEEHQVAVSVADLHSTCLDNVNGNWGVGQKKQEAALCDGLFVNVVPNVNTEFIPKESADFSPENYKKYSISESGDERTDQVFREWHEVLDTPSYNGEIMKILPYVIID